MPLLSPHSEKPNADDAFAPSSAPAKASGAHFLSICAARAAGFARRLPRRTLRICAVIAVAAFAAGVARSTYYQPVGASVSDPINPGSPLNVTIQLDGGPASVTVSSDPPGAVSYQGTIHSGDTITAATASEINASTVNVYVVTDGETYVVQNVPVN